MRDNFSSHFKNGKKDISDHNILFTRLSELIKKISKDGEEQLISNNDIKNYTCSKYQTPFIVDQTQKCQRSESDFDLKHIIFKMNWRMYLKGIALNLGQYLAGCLGIYFLDCLTDELQSPQFQSASKARSIQMIILIFICFFLKTILFSQAEWIMQCHDSKQQTLMQYLIFKKSLKTKSYCDSRDHSTEVDISNLLTTDSKEAVFIFYGIVELISGNITLLVILYFIYLKLGDAIIYGLIVLIISVILNVYVLNLINKYFDLEQSWTDKRLSLTKDVVEGMKSIKYLGWEEVFLNKIKELRRREFTYTKKSRYVGAFAGVLWICLGYILLYVFLMSYSWYGNDILQQNIFTVIALFGYLKYPLGNIPYSLSYLLKSLVSLKRIQSFLNQKEISFIDYDVKPSDESQQYAIQIHNSEFFWPRINQENKQQEQQILDGIELKYEQDLTNDSELFIKSQEAFSLCIQNFKISKGTLNFIIGEIEIEQSPSRDQKRIKINGSIGYVSPNHWLQSKTIRQNILFGSLFHQEWYSTCVEACQLKEEFAQFPQSDLKIIGPGGSNLSGGQRQRIALCRAIYQKKDIYLFDDIFSSLDAHVAKEILEQAIINLLQKQMSSTVLFVTSHYTLFEEGSKHNYSIILLKNGTISTDSQEIQMYLFSSSQQKLCKEEQEQNQIPLNNHLLNIDQTKINESNDFDRADKDVSLETKSIESSKRIKLANEGEKNEQENEEEERQKGGINASTIMLFFKSRGFIVTVLHILFSFITQASQMIIDFWLRDFQQEEKQTWLVLILNQMFDSFNQIFQALTVINLIIALLCGLFYALSAIKSSRYIFTKLNTSIIFSKLTFFDTNPLGRIISRVSTDQNKVDDVLQWHFHVLLEKLSYLIGYPIGMIIQLPYLSIHFAVIMIMVYMISLRYRAATRQIKRLNQVNEGQVLTVLSENCKGVPTIRAMNKNDYMMTDFLEQIDKAISSQMVSNGLSIWFVCRLFLLSNSCFLFVVISNIYSIIRDGEVHENRIALGLIYSMLFSTVFSDVMNFYTYFEQDILAIERISQYFGNDQEQLNIIPPCSTMSNSISCSFSKQSKGNENEVINSESIPYSIEFKNVYLQYQHISSQSDSCQEDGDDNRNNNKYALNNVSFKIKKGEKIAFCGRTGSGKTSILNALFRLYDIKSGQVLINKKDIYQQSLSQVRQQMSIIPQYGFLYQGTFHQNLDPNNTLSQTEISSVLSQFQSLQIKRQDNNSEQSQFQSEISKIKYQDSHEKVESSTLIPNSDDNILNMEIQESGKNLSNGEKQILNFFRIVFRNSDILCLDEATSNMDPKTDKELHEELFKYSQGKTLIVITHRLENIEMYDRVFVMDQGSIVESGHVNYLRTNANGFFNRLIQSK